ncbi:MAG TPA: flagellar export chaperone FlgN [Anaerohalosphaeraceae bacterium]|nr:flagellar export chaperone FlgN [Phycisphaerae bacterium]HOK96651.1 flagellar export chaperone FlgN [Anaerohalosphaeraceae bacterium]HOL30775.1 flagellar export chaperone FlgN [Anaerohalosphaeraceae bacterium]HOM75410.1 flagellar export chaperone FlgN [Anaerohalosphaeraceae bacterium]HPC63030.1 flagellar export chaperone FlgN [Anaerohalosphaeraceae bacterium]
MNSDLYATELDNCIGRLLAVLDADIEYLENTILRLGELRCLVIKHRYQPLEQMLQTIRTEYIRYRKNESQRQAICRKIGLLLGCPSDVMTLSDIAAHLPPDKRTRLLERRVKLQTLTDLLRREYAGVQMLLADCARLNRMLLANLLGTGCAESKTYQSTGTAERQTGTLFMDARC